jgi:DNA-binding PadR family transcriptional regulator
MKRLVLTLLAAVISIILAMVLIWYSKNNMVKTMSRRHVLHMLRSKTMSAGELAHTARESESTVITHKLLPVLLVRLQEEGLIQKSGSIFAITTKGLESLKSLDSASREFMKIAKIIDRTSTVSKFLMSEAIERIAAISNIDMEESRRTVGRESISVTAG